MLLVCCEEQGSTRDKLHVLSSGWFQQHSKAISSRIAAAEALCHWLQDIQQELAVQVRQLVEPGVYTRLTVKTSEGAQQGMLL